jgi:hypothetical protein
MKKQKVRELEQIASAMMTIVFAAVMLVSGWLYVENRSLRASPYTAPKVEALSTKPEALSTSTVKAGLRRRTVVAF